MVATLTVTRATSLLYLSMALAPVEMDKHSVLAILGTMA